MNYELLNKIIDYLEENLTNDINTKNLAKSLGLNDFIMQRVFSIITNITITEYARKRNTRNYSY
ncbi:MAG TPA: helix-turn-helix transcriptional regulator [Candidatus Aphodocola excrementigallinarum]|uniref:Helix-turn-helix transcriptional regulator n=1 Tax=Candidatus Aphodocola excrementigallinarum TaxID=2840670 RepID=A0A9D1IQJ1_9FIRM|nr:helix-turn-helix transcriptional regulator [Candidatus Aphodocola excrementigallinarum]